MRWEQPSMRMREAHLVVTVSLDDEGPEHDETMSPVSVAQVGGWVGSAVESKGGRSPANPNSSSIGSSSSSSNHKSKSNRNDRKTATQNNALHHGVPKLRLPSSSLPSSISVGARPGRGCWCGGAADAGTVSVAASIQALAQQLELKQHGLVDGGTEDDVGGYSPAEKAVQGAKESQMMVSSSSTGRHGGGEVDEKNAVLGWGSGGATPSSSARVMPAHSSSSTSSSSSSSSSSSLSAPASGSRGDAAPGKTQEPLITFDDDFNNGQVVPAATASSPAPSDNSMHGNNNSSFQSPGRLATSAGGWTAASASVSLISFEEGEEAVGERSCIVGDDDDSDHEGAQLLSPERGGDRRLAGGTLRERDEEVGDEHVEDGAAVDLAGALELALSSSSADSEHNGNRWWAMLGLLLCYRGAKGPGWSGDSIVTRLRASFSQGLGIQAVAMLTTWLTDVHFDFEDVGMRDALDAFIHPAPGSPPDWRGMEEARERFKKDCEQRLTSLADTRSYLEESIAALMSVGEGGSDIGSDAADHLGLDVGEIASYLTVRESCMFLSIKYADLISPNPRGARAVASIEGSHEEQAQWVERCVCGAAKAKHQARLISHFLDIADACMALGNMPSTLAIWQGLQSEAVRSLQDANARALGKARTISVYGVIGQQCTRLMADGLAGKKPGENYVPFIGGAMDRIQRCHMGAALFVGEGRQERINLQVGANRALEAFSLSQPDSHHRGYRNLASHPSLVLNASHQPPNSESSPHHRQVAANIARVAVPCIMRHQHSRYPPQFSQSVASYMQAQLGTGAISYSIGASRSPNRTEPPSPAIPNPTPQGCKMPAW